jgi:hypothetical protein
MQVDLYESGTIAIVEAVSPELGNRVQRVRVQLPGTSSELLNKFREKNVDYAAHTNTEDGGAVFLNLLGDFFGHESLLTGVHNYPQTIKSDFQTIDSSSVTAGSCEAGEGKEDT